MARKQKTASNKPKARTQGTGSQPSMQDTQAQAPHQGRWDRETALGSNNPSRARSSASISPRGRKFP